MSLRQAREEWGVRHQVLYRLELAGRLLAIRYRNKVLYSRAQLLEELGPPLNPGPQSPQLRRRNRGRMNEDRVTGPQHGQHEFNFAAAAA